MEVFRISAGKYAHALTASGRAARWNFNDQWIIYTSISRSLATLENIVHRANIKPAVPYKVMVISINDNPKFYANIAEKDLPDNWREPNNSKAQEIGNQWYKSSESLILKVPSAIIPMEHNYIININHPNFNKGNASLVRVEDYFWDERLL